MIVVLKDYEGNKRYNPIKDSIMEQAVSICLLTLSGDEVLFVFTKNGETIQLDSSDSRFTDYLDEIKVVTIDELKKTGKILLGEKDEK